MARRPVLLAGNWKMHKSRSDAEGFFSDLEKLTGPLNLVTKNIQLAFGVPSTLFDTCNKEVSGKSVKILAQNVHFEAQGAYTGELSVPMLKDAAVVGSIIGHSERRQYFAETDEAVGKKWTALVQGGLLPIVCVGETRAQREANQTQEVVCSQLLEAIKQVPAPCLDKPFVVAYEPVWAIGTGLTATPEQAQEVHQVIRLFLAKHLGTKKADETQILYGGSMNSSNCKALLAMADIDGGLIGGASLKAEEFSKMVKDALL